jgi:carbon-monoxide dehydrogenase large subunit
MIGESPRRREDLRLLTGRGRYVEDLTRPGLCHLGVVRSLHAHARLGRVDGKAALALPGVVAVWSAGDLPEAATPAQSGTGAAHRGRPWAMPLLARERVRYVGEPVAVVVAEDPYRLADALEAVNVEYEPLPALVDCEAARIAPVVLHDGWPDNTTLPVGTAIGDPDQGFARAHVVVEARFAHPRLAAVPIETRGALAEPDPEAGGVVLWASIQNPYSLREAVAAALPLPSADVRVRVPDVGGAFGPKGSVYPDEVLVAVAAWRLGRPVRWIESRRESLAAQGHDREQVHRARLGLDADGRIVALETRFLADVGAYPAEGTGLTANTVNHLPGPYRVPHYRGRGESVVTTKTVNAAYRGAGRPEANFVMERLMDLGARRLGLDPAEVRRRNLVRPEEMPYRPGIVYKDGVAVAYDPGDFPRALERALAALGWDEWRQRQRERRGTPEGRLRPLGLGLACYAQGTGLGPFEGAEVRVDPSGRVDVLIGVAAQGQGHATTLAQIAAAELGARLEQVSVVAGDTGRFPFGMGTGGSRVMANAGPAVARTAREVRERAGRVAAEMLECAPEDVRIAEGRAHVAGAPDRALGLGEVARAAVRSRVLRTSGEPGLHACTYFYPDTVTWAFGCQAAVVEVDRETGQVRLLRYAIVHDPGRAIHPAIVEGQLQGGAAQSIGAALFEAVRYDAAGQLLTGSLMDYAIPRALDLPWLEVALEAHPSRLNPLGVKGVGESGCIPAGAAVANAVEDALGQGPITEIPLLPASVLALARAGASGNA